MEISLDYWFLFPVSTLIATIAMATGIGGAVFFSPIFMILLKLEPRIAIGSALITELFGFTSGMIAYYKAKLIDFKLAYSLLIFSIPAAIIGSYYADLVSATVLKTIFAVGIIFIGFQIFNSWRKEERKKQEEVRREEFSKSFESELISKSGKIYHYTICNKKMGQLFAFIGGLFLGMISVGLAELQEFHLVARCKVPAPVAVATSIFVVVITVLVASLGHIYEFAKGGDEALSHVINVIIFTIPGVILGGQLGPGFQKIVPEDKMKVSISILFILVGFFMMFTLINA